MAEEVASSHCPVRMVPLLMAVVVEGVKNESEEWAVPPLLAVEGVGVTVVLMVACKKQYEYTVN